MQRRTLLVRPQLGFDLLRICLGIGLMVRGALFARDPALLDQLLGGGGWFLPALTAHVVVLPHVVGGLLLALGCYTRLAAAVQVPVLAGALFFVHLHEGLFSRSQSLELVALVLVALISYALCGAGELSVDHHFAGARPELATQEPALGFAAESAHPTDPRAIERASAFDAPPGSRASTNLPLPADPARVRWLYRDLELELIAVLVVLVVLGALLAAGLYVAAPMWLISTLVLFLIWRIGRTEFG